MGYIVVRDPNNHAAKKTQWVVLSREIEHLPTAKGWLAYEESMWLKRYPHSDHIFRIVQIIS